MGEVNVVIYYNIVYNVESVLQDHYDFGMRAVKSVISAAGNLKRQNQDMDEVCVSVVTDTQLAFRNSCTNISKYM